MSDYVGEYRILGQLGTGQFGTVYLAEGVVPSKFQTSTQVKRVAVKVLKDPGDPTAQASLVREFQLMDQVRHRSLCRFYDYLESDSAVVMEWIQGVDLRKVLDTMRTRDERIDVQAIAALGCELADCLYQSFASPGADGQALNLVHRDLKPENIMLTPNGEVKLLDFGLARVRKPSGPKKRMVMGTPLYMAPEQANGRLVDHRTDLFALGLILYEMLMGEPAYEVNMDVDDPEAEVMARIESGALVSEIKKVEERYPQVGYMISRCLQANPRSRYTNGHELLLDLRGLLPRESGVYLDQFCTYFFSAIHPLKLEGPESEARRVEPMSNSKRPPRPTGKPPRPSNTGKAPNQSGSRPSAAPPSPGRPPGPRGARPTRPPGSGRRPAGPRKPSGVSAPRAPASPAASVTPAPQQKKARFGLGDSRARSPEENGMLRMVPLGDDDGAEDHVPSSATQFFAIPKSRTKKKSKPAAGAAPRLGTSGATAGPHSAGQIAGPASNGAPPGAPPFGLTGPVAPPAGGMSQARPGGGMGIQGPLASGSVAAGPVQPFAHVVQQESVPDTHEGRSRSLRLFGILAIFMVLLGGTFLVVVGALVVAMNPEWTTGASSSSAANEDSVNDVLGSMDDEDEEVDDEPNYDNSNLREPTAPSRSRKRSGSGRSSGSGSSNSGASSSGASSSGASSSGSSVAKPRPKAKSGPISIKVKGGNAKSVRMSCDDGKTDNIRLTGGSGKSSSSVKGSATCQLSFKTVNGLSKKGTVKGGGRTFTCDLSGTRASCK